MVKARKLDYDTVFAALKRGDFYSSTGPEIKSLYLDGDKVVIKTSAVKQIALITDMRITEVIDSAKTGKTVSGGELSLAKLIEKRNDLGDSRKSFFRIEITDKCGRKALTRAYFLDELGL